MMQNNSSTRNPIAIFALILLFSAFILNASLFFAVQNASAETNQKIPAKQQIKNTKTKKPPVDKKALIKKPTAVKKVIKKPESKPTPKKVIPATQKKIQTAPPIVHGATPILPSKPSVVPPTIVRPTNDITSNFTNALIDGFAFLPASLTIQKGTTVTWTNDDSAPHTVTAQNKSFQSGTLQKGSQFSFTFNVPGSYEYICAIHPSMRAKVIVTE